MKGSDNVCEDDVGNSEWAVAMQNILCMDKPKSKSSFILSRAEKLTPKLEAECEDDKETQARLIAQANLKKEWMSKGRYKPVASEEGERERKLRKVAVAGVVQLFNAVGKHQRTAGSDINSKVSTSSTKSFKPLDKKSFLGLLLGKNELKVELPESSYNQIVNEVKNEEDEIKEEELDEDNQDKAPKWDVLRNDFMMSTKLKDWDKEVDT